MSSTGDNLAGERLNYLHRAMDAEHRTQLIVIRSTSSPSNWMTTVLTGVTRWALLPEIGCLEEWGWQVECLSGPRWHNRRELAENGRARAAIADRCCRSYGCRKKIRVLDGYRRIGTITRASRVHSNSTSGLSGGSIDVARVSYLRIA